MRLRAVRKLKALSVRDHAAPRQLPAWPAAPREKGVYLSIQYEHTVTYDIKTSYLCTLSRDAPLVSIRDI